MSELLFSLSVSQTYSSKTPTENFHFTVHQAFLVLSILGSENRLVNHLIKNCINLGLEWLNYQFKAKELAYYAFLVAIISHSVMKLESSLNPTIISMIQLWTYFIAIISRSIMKSKSTVNSITL